MFTAQYESSLDFFFLGVKGPGTAMIGIYIVTQASRFPFLKILLLRLELMIHRTKCGRLTQFVFADPVCLKHEWLGGQTTHHMATGLFPVWRFPLHTLELTLYVLIAELVLLSN